MRYLTILLSSALLATSAYAQGASQPFSATAVQQLPGQPERRARIFVTPDKVRMEYPETAGGRIEITDMKGGRAYVLLPRQRVYAPREMTRTVVAQMQQSGRTTDPCAAQPLVQCAKLGDEQLFGRPVEKWQMVVEHEGRSYRSLYWVDTERFMPLRQIWADGTVTELQPAGQERRGSRHTEKWQLVTQAPDGRKHTAEQWFDPELQIMIAESLPGGYRRELRDIRVADQDPALFRVPEGYRQVAAEATSSGLQQDPGRLPATDRFNGDL